MKSGLLMLTPSAMNATLTPAPVYPSAWAASPVPDWVAAWMFSIASGSSWTVLPVVQAPGSGLSPLAFAALCAMVTGESLPWSGIGRSGTTSLTAGLPARYLASPGETVAETALISEKVFTLAAWVWPSCVMTALWVDLTSAARTVALLGVSATPVNWFLNTTITLSVTLVDNAAACAADSGGWTAAGVAARAVVCASAAAGSAMADMATNVTGVAIAAPRKSLLYRI